MPVQWAQLGAGGVLVASQGGAWIQPPGLSAIALRGDMPASHPATIATTRHLLDGAIAVAERTASATKPPALTEQRWAWSLVGQWACAHHSVALLPELIERFESCGREDLATFARVKLEEEAGHDQFPLADLRALGYDADVLTAAADPPPSVSALLAYARACVRGTQPVEFIGYMYALERRVLACSPAWLASVEAVLPPGARAMSAVRAHAREFDAVHVEEAVQFIAGLHSVERARIALGAYRTTQVACRESPGEHPSEAELDRRLARFRHLPLAPPGSTRP